MEQKKAEKLIELLNNIIDASWLIDKMDVKYLWTTLAWNKTNNKSISKDSKKHEFIWKVVDLFSSTKIFTSAESIVNFAINDLKIEGVKNNYKYDTIRKRNPKEVTWIIAVEMCNEPNEKLENYLKVLEKIDTKKVKTEEEFKTTWSDLIRNVL